MLAKFKYTDEEILNIYENEYIAEHVGGTSLAKKYGVNFYLDFKRLGLEMRNNHEKGRKFCCNSDFFNIIDDETKAYWLGFCYADGYITSLNSVNRFGLSITKGDESHLIKFKTAIGSDAPIHTYTVKQGYKIGTEYCRITIQDEKFAENLIKHGCVKNKSNIIEPPVGVSEALEKHFIRGFMDGNGSIKITRTQYPYVGYEICFVSTDQMLQWIMSHLINNHVLAHEYPLRKRKDGQIVSFFAFGGNIQVKRFLDYIYDDATVWLDRKHDRYLELCAYLHERGGQMDGG